MRHPLVAGVLVAIAAIAPEPARAVATMFEQEGSTVEIAPGNVPLLDFVRTVHDLTGETFFYEPKVLARIKLSVLGSARVPRDRLLAFFDACLRQCDVVRLERTLGGTRVHELRALGQQARGQVAMKSLARIVTSEELAAISDRQELVTTTWAPTRLPGGFDHGVCQFFSDSSIQSIRRIQGTRHLVMTGCAAEVARCIELLERVDADPAVASQGTDDGLEKRVAGLEQRVEALRDRGR